MLDNESVLKEVQIRNRQNISISEMDIILNRDFTFNDAYACLEKLDSIPFQKSGDSVTVVELERISTELNTIISNGTNPYGISINQSLSIIDVFGSDGNCEIPVEIAGPCVWFQDGLNNYQNCNFMPVAEHMPLHWSFFCKSANPTTIPDNDYTKDYFSKQVNLYFPKPDNLHYFTNDEIYYYNCDGCDNVEAQDYKLWHTQHGGTNLWNLPDCLEKADMDDYFCSIYDVIIDNQPIDKEFWYIELSFSTLGDLNTSTYSHWAARIHYGTPNLCCECCC